MSDTIERAFVLAGSGKFRTIDELRRALSEEGGASVDAHLSGVAIRKQLRQLMASSRSIGPETAA